MRGWDGKIERWGENDNGVTKALEMLEEVKVILNGLT